MRYRLTREDQQGGGLNTVEHHGREHMARIGAIGFTRTCELYYNGDRSAYIDHLRERGLLAACDGEFAAMLSLYQERLPDLF